MKLKCVAVDDEPLALELLEDYTGKIEFLELVHKCTSPMEAFSLIRNKKIDILFLDIQMPELSGFELLEALTYKPQIIITSAFEKFALESYTFDVTDYLLKPVSFTRFLKAIEKALTRSGIMDSNQNLKIETNKNYIFIYTNAEIIKIPLEDILYFKGLSDFITLKTISKSYIVRDNLKRIEEMLEGRDFVRIHKSFIVPVPKIESVKANKVKIGNELLPIGRVYKIFLYNKIRNEILGNSRSSDIFG